MPPFTSRPARLALMLSLSSALLPGSALAQQSAPTEAGESMAQSTARETDMDDARARAAFRVGQQHYQQGRFAEAATEFERAYGLSGRAPLLYNAYLAYRDAGDTANALRALRSYLTQMPNAPDHEHLEARLNALQTQVSADEEREAAARAEAQAARMEAEDARRTLEEARRARTRTVQGEFWPWVVAGIGGAMVVTGIITGVMALETHSRIQSECQLDLCPSGFGIEGQRSTLTGLSVTTDVMLFGGAAVAATGIVLGILYGLDREEVLPSEVQSAGVFCGPEGCTLNVGVSL